MVLNLPAAKTDIANIILILISFVLALLLPFDLFLISYAILGPLHYTTEISWLQKRDFFANNKTDGKAVMAICFVVAALVTLVTLHSLFKDSALFLGLLKLLGYDYETFLKQSFLINSSLIFLAFAFSFILTFVRDWWKKINCCVVAIAVVAIFHNVAIYLIIFGFLLATLIHVWLFTGIFMIQGALKNKNLVGYVSFAVFLLCSAAFLFITKSDNNLSAKAMEIISSSRPSITEFMMGIFKIPFDANDIFRSENFVKMSAFVSFAYTYHYLNWFSKVEVIKWHQVSKKSLIFSFVVWLAALALYGHDYTIGGLALLFLSLLHVLLELPLNFRSIARLIKIR
jgi:hypothetical protein